jgi:hypothetical protein
MPCAAMAHSTKSILPSLFGKMWIIWFSNMEEILEPHKNLNEFCAWQLTVVETLNIDYTVWTNWSSETDFVKPT